jgi:hypothetical protein
MPYFRFLIFASTKPIELFSTCQTVSRQLRERDIRKSTNTPREHEYLRGAKGQGQKLKFTIAFIPYPFAVILFPCSRVYFSAC